jgi:methylthioribose-1-phosphate isomerase
MAEAGAALLPVGVRVLTHCNTGALATGGHGTALGVIRTAWAQGKLVHVYADETRPWLQGSRLTAWELQREGMPGTLLCDGAAASLMQQGMVDWVIVGADRIVANGDVANKIGTYTVAVLAHEHGIPFYVAAPISTIDLATPDGSRIPIEERSAREVTHMGPARLTPEAAKVRNPAFDVTPHKYVTAIITERGIARAPFSETLPYLVDGEQVSNKRV